MYANHNIDYDKRSSGLMTSSKLRGPDITTSKKYERPAPQTPKAKVSQKYSIRPAQNLAASPSLREIQPHHPKPPPLKSRVIPVSASQSKADTLRLLQEQMRMLENWKRGQLFEEDAFAKKTIRNRARGSASVEKTLDKFPTKIKSNIHVRKADQYNLMQQSWPRLHTPKLQTCYEDSLESPTAPRETLNASVSMAHFTSNFSPQMSQQPEKQEKEVQFSTTISDFVDILDIKSNVNNKQTTTIEAVCESSSTQTMNISSNMRCQICAKVSNISTQVISELETEQNCSGLEETIVEDCDNLLRTLKMHDCRQNVNQVFGTPAFRNRCLSLFQNLASSESDDKLEFSNVLEGFFNFHQNLPEDSIMQFTEDVFSASSLKAESNATIEQSEKSVVKQSEPAPPPQEMKNVTELIDAIQNSSRLIIELNSVTMGLQNTFQSIITPGAVTADEISHSDYKTVDPGSSQSLDIITKECTDTDKTEYMPVPERTVLQLPDVNLEKIINDLDSAVLEINEDKKHNQIKTSISNISTELVKILRYMKLIGGPSICKLKIEEHEETEQLKKARNQSVDRVKNTLKKDQPNLRKSKSHTDVLLPYESKRKSTVIPKSSAESLTSNFSTCTELSFAEFNNFECPPLPKHGAGDHVFKTQNKEENSDITKALSNVSTNTDDIDSVAKNHYYVRYKPLRSAVRRSKRRQPLKLHKSLNYVKPTTSAVYKISEYHSTFATKSALDHFPMLSKNRKLIVLSQTPSVGDLKYTCKECNKDSAIIVQSSSSCEYDGANNTNLLSINSSNHLNPKPIPDKTTCTPYPETTLVNDTSNVTLAEDISLSEMNKPVECSVKKSCDGHNSIQSEMVKTSYTEMGVQKDVPAANIRVQSVQVQALAQQDAAVQNQVPYTDKDISTDILDSKSIGDESVATQIDNKQLCVKKSVTDDEYLSVTSAPSTYFSLPKFNTKREMKLDFGSELVCAVKEKCAQMPKKMVETVLTRLQATFNLKLPDDMSDLQCHLTNLANFTPPVPGFEILGVRCIGDSSVLIKWKRGPSKTIRGYEVYINSALKTKIHSSSRCTAVIDFILPKSTLTICVCAMAEGNQVEQMAKATFKMT